MSELSGDTIRESRYELVVYWSDEDGAFIAEVPDLPGCMADGPTHAAAAQAAERVIHEWIETSRELGRPIPEPNQTHSKRP